MSKKYLSKSMSVAFWGDLRMLNYNIMLSDERYIKCYIRVLDYARVVGVTGHTCGGFEL